MMEVVSGVGRKRAAGVWVENKEEEVASAS